MLSLKRCFKIKPLNRLTAAGGCVGRSQADGGVCQRGAAWFDDGRGPGAGHEPVSGQPAGAATGAGRGVTLLHRSTRKLALTEAGQRYHAQCAAMCAAAEQARAELAAARDAPSGELRMSATVGFARHVSPALGAMLAQYPSLRLRLLVDDAPLISSTPGWTWRCALAAWPIRPGRHAGWGAGMVAVRLARVSGPAWQPRNARCPAGPWLAGLCTRRGGPAAGPEGPEGAARSLRVEPRIVSNNQLSIQQMCEAGLGVALMGSLDAGRAGIRPPGAAVAAVDHGHPGYLGRDAPAGCAARQGAAGHCGLAALSRHPAGCWSSGAGCGQIGADQPGSHPVNGEEPAFHFQIGQHPQRAVDLLQVISCSSHRRRITLASSFSSAQAICRLGA